MIVRKTTLRRLAGFAILASLRPELGDLDRIAARVHSFGMVNWRNT